MRSISADRLVSGLAIAAYTAVLFAGAWITAHAYALDVDPDLARGGLGVAALIFSVFVLPVLTGFAVGRWWAPAIVFCLIVVTGIADELEPLQRELEGEYETGDVALLALFAVCLHIPLLLLGVVIRKLTWPRPRGKRWTLI